MADIFGAIANPAQANILGAVDAGRERQAKDLAGKIMGQTFAGQLGDLARLSPDMAAKFADNFNIPKTSKGRINNMIGTIIKVANVAKAGMVPEAAQMLQEEITNIEQFTGEGSATALRNALQAFQTQDPEVLQGFFETANSLEASLTTGQTAQEKSFNSLIKDLSPADQKKAKRIKVGLDPRAMGSAIQTIAKEGTADFIAKAESVVAEGREGGKMQAQLKFKPMIAEAVTLANKAAVARGDTLTDLMRTEAALPGLLESVGQLKGLASIATSTIGGRAFDFAVKESGFGSTKGANARAKFISIIDNQVLPLLKQTFGAAFTEREGDALRATMGDPDATPSQKMLQLEAFIDQKVRTIQSKQREVGEEVTPAAELTAQEITSQSAYDALPSGAVYLEDGKQYRKP